MTLKHAAANSGWRFVRTLADKTSNLVLIMLLARWLGPADFGLLGAAAAYVGLFNAVAGASWQPLLVQELVRSPKSAPAILGSGMVLLLALNLAAVILAVAGLFLPWHKPGQMFLVLALLHMPLLVFNSQAICMTSWFQSRLQDKKYLPAGFAVNLIRISSKASIAYLGAPLWAVASAEPGAGMLRSVWLWSLWKKSAGQKTRLIWEKSCGLRLWKHGWPLLIWGSMTVVFQNIDQVMLFSMQGQETAGVYLAAVRLTSVWTTIPALILPSMLPYLAQLRDRDGALYLVRTKQLMFVMTWTAILAALAVCFVLARPLVNLLYGSDYNASVSILSISIWSNVLGFQALVRGQWILLEGLQRFAIFFPLVGAVSNISMNYFLIPKYGAMGAAWATIFSQALAVVITPFFFKPTRASSFMLLRSLLPWWPGAPGKRSRRSSVSRNGGTGHE